MRTSSQAIAGALCLTLWGCGQDADRFALPKGTPVILVVIDTLRADHLSSYGYDLETSPNLDVFAASAHQFMANATQYNSTFPAITSILTGLYPKTHGNYLAVPVGDSAGQGMTETNLAHRMKSGGYYCAAVTSHPSWSAVDHDALLFDGWDHFSVISAEVPVSERRRLAKGEHTNERVFRALDEYAQRDDDESLFLWVHYFDPHTDHRGLVYDPPAHLRNTFLTEHLQALGLEEHESSLANLDPVARRDWLTRELKASDPTLWSRLRLANGRALYDAEILSCDQAVGELLERLEQMGIAEQALIIICADHGENMDGPREARERLAFTHQELFEAVAHTPLFVKLPGQTEPSRIGALTQNIDIVPTILELLDLSANPPVDGRSLVPMLRDSEAVLHEQVFVESSGRQGLAVKTDDLKLISTGGKEADVAYAWRDDPGEWADVLGELDSEVRDRLQSAAQDYRPQAALHFAVLPAERPFHLEIEIETTGKGFTSVAGVPQDAIQDKGRRFRWSGTVGEEALMVTLLRSPAPASDRWLINHELSSDLTRDIWIGKSPVRETTVIPLWQIEEGPVPSNPQLELWRHDNGRQFRARLRPTGNQSLQAEYRCSSLQAWKDLARADGKGFGPLVKRDDGVALLTAGGSEPAWATLRSGHLGDVSELYRFDGAWPDPGKVVVDGKPVAGDRLGLLFPHPPDGRVIADLRTGFYPDRVSGGSIVIWSESMSGSVELDAARIDPELLEELRALGYAK